MAKSNGIILSIVALGFLGIWAGMPRISQAEQQKKAGTSKVTAVANNKSEATKAASEVAVPPLSPEIVHRIQTELRSRYNVPPQITISFSDPKAGSTPGYDDLVVTFQGGTHTTNHDFLVSRDRKTLAHLETIDISQDLMSKIDMKGRPVRGNPEAKVTIVNYDDFQCPFCSRMHSTLFANVFKDYGDKVRIVYKDYPLIEIHPWAMHAAIDGNCLGDQNNQAYWDFADQVHASQRDVAGHNRAEALANLDKMVMGLADKHHLDSAKVQACIQKADEGAVRASMAEGDKLGVDSTPTLFINGERFTGVIPEQDLRAVLDRALADNGQAPQQPAPKSN